MYNQFIGEKINGYIIKDYINEGMIGKVFKAYREDIDDYRAVKFIPKLNLRGGWENEITKVIKLKNVTGVVTYYDHGFITIDGNEYLYMAWDYIESKSLKDLINENSITMPILVDVFEQILHVLHACGRSKIIHADLHSGNILIESENNLLLNPERRRVYITDFGYATADGKLDILDDFKGLLVIISNCISVLDFHNLDGKEKMLYRIFKNEIPKILVETNVIEGAWVRNPQEILKKWYELRDNHSQNEIISQNIGDYLAAEHIGRNYEEWGKLFVPKILAVDELLSKNICVLTGLRGCGKTMIFRRLTAIFDAHLGPSMVEGSDGFIGFYLNARNIAEAFPWLPDKHETNARQQVINYFHVSWCLEIIEWVKIISKNLKSDLSWLTKFFNKFYPDKIYTSSEDYNILFHLTSFFSQQLDRSRLRSNYNKDVEWELSSLTFLEEFSNEIISNCNIGNKSIYFFLDDYSTPLVTKCTQRILNPVIFRRSSSLFFKVATESSESFEPIGLNGKVLEEEDDYKLIDFGTCAYSLDKSQIKDLLSSIIQKRIERHSRLADKNYDLEKLIGPTEINNTRLSLLIRNGILENSEGKTIKKDKYVGIDVFCSMWSSDIRESISLFAEMISNVNFDTLNDGRDKIINDDIQDKAYRDAGGKFLSLLETATNPSTDSYDITRGQRSFGSHLVEIAKAFQEISSYSLVHRNSKNVNTTPPKQARRIEITSVEYLDGELYDYYRGILRYGVFIRDYKGKSIRGKVVPRLYLRGLLIPSFRLSFSKRDSITMNWEEFCFFLRDPKKFKVEYILKLKNTEENDQQMKILYEE